MTLSHNITDTICVVAFLTFIGFALSTCVDGHVRMNKPTCIEESVNDE